MTDQRLEVFISNLLRAGVLTAAVVVMAGRGFYLAQHHSQSVSYRTFHAPGEDLRTVPGILRSAIHIHSEGLIQLGLLLLIATPIARVILAAVGFYLERDRLYVIVSLTVLAILAYSIMHAT
ncbi:MAG TPA: DUF1634 domain-containing protein [Candidatus Angelobacter sp.]|jgi:uncharacterized membrane protein